MPIGINGSGTITGVSVGGLPDSIITSAELATDSVTTTAITNANVTPAKLSQPFTFEPVRNANGLTTIDFTGIPLWARLINIAYYGLSTSSTGVVVLRIGTGGTVETTGYLCSTSTISSTVLTNQYTTYFAIDNIANASGVRHGTVTLQMSGNDVWTATGVMGRSDTAATYIFGGRLVLTGPLDIVRISLTASDTFDNGYISLSYQG